MSKTIEIKGKTYDAVTGEIVIDAVKPAAKKQPAKAAAKHTVKPSTTLMRSAVKKPAAHVIKVQSEIQPTADTPEITHSTVAHKVDRSRLERAKSTPSHSNIKRFYAPEPRPVLETTFAPTEVKPAPAEVPAAHSDRRESESNIFMNAIANSNHHVDIKAHTARQRQKARRHYAGMIAGASALFLLALFGWYLNNPGLQIRVAGMQAGVATMDPNFHKAGFSFASVHAQDGKRVIELKSEATKAVYHLTQQSTNWDSDTMIQHVSSVGADGTLNYTTVRTGMGTVYKFGEEIRKQRGADAADVEVTGGTGSETGSNHGY